MIQTEEQLLDFLTSHGFDFMSTTSEIARRFPTQLDWGHPSFPVIPYELSLPFIGPNPVWKIPVTRPVDQDLPPLRYFHEFHPSQDARRNHDHAESELAALFGTGEMGMASNVYERRWRIGYFSVQVITWPSELNRGGHNGFEKLNPYLWISAKISIEPEFPFIQKTEDASIPLDVLVEQEPGVRLSCDSPAYARRNRVPSRRTDPVAGLSRDREFLIRTSARTIRVPLDQIRSLRHTRHTPGRTSGSSNLELETLFLGRHEVRVRIVDGIHTGTLDPIAARLAQALGKPIEVNEYAEE